MYFSWYRKKMLLRFYSYDSMLLLKKKKKDNLGGRTHDNTGCVFLPLTLSVNSEMFFGGKTCSLPMKNWLWRE